MKTLIIAEAGVNHNGDIELAKKLIASASAAGADLVKFQSFVTSKNIAEHAPKAQYQNLSTDPSESQFEMVRKLELSREDHVALVKECNKYNIGFFSTAF
jgi:N,N'-diacetyllegionaminate synthase